MFDFRRITLFCLEKRLSKHKMTIFSKNVGVWPLCHALATPMVPGKPVAVFSSFVVFCTGKSTDLFSFQRGEEKNMNLKDMLHFYFRASV